MAEITLKFDARNQIAKKTIDYILSIGVFTENKKIALGKPRAQKTVVKLESPYNKRFVEKILNSSKQKTGKIINPNDVWASFK